MSELDDPYLSVKQIADYFSVKPWTIRNWIKEGKLRGAKPGDGGHYRVRQSEVARLANEMYGD